MKSRSLKLNTLAGILLVAFVADASAVTYNMRFPSKGLQWSSPDIEFRDPTTNAVLSGLSFPPTPVGKSTPRAFKFVNKSASAITFTGTPFAAGSPFTLASTTCAGTLATTSSCLLNLTFNPTAAQAFSQYLGMNSSLSNPSLPTLTGAGYYSLVAGVYATTDRGYIQRPDGSWMVAGDNGGNQSGVLGASDYPSFVPVPELAGATQLVTGATNTFAQKSDGTWWAVGTNSSYELGTGDNINRTQFTRVPALDGATQVYGGDSYSIARMADGFWRVIGYSGLGRLGMGASGDKTTWTAVPALVGALQVVPGNDSTFMQKADGTWWVTGNNSYGRLGVGDNSSYKDTYTYVPGIDGATTVIQSGRGFNALAKMADGTWKGVGYNGGGQLGLGADTVNKNLFTPIPALTGAAYVTPNNGELTLMRNASGSWYGTGTLASYFSQSNSSTFVLIPALAGAAQVSLPQQSPLYIKMADGRLFAAGRNWYGELGEGDYNQQIPPVLVSP